MGIFRLVFTTFAISIFVYICHQLTRFAELSTLSSVTIVLGFAALFTFVLSTMFASFKSRSTEVNPLKDLRLDIALMGMVYINFVLSLVVIRDVFAFIQSLFQEWIPTNALYGSLATVIILTLPFVLLFIGNMTVRFGPRSIQVPLYFKNLSPDLEGLRVVHITDLHISSHLPASFVDKVVENVLNMKPDFVVFTGDILDSFAEKHPAEFASLKKLSDQFRVYFVPGNHEYYWNGPAGMKAFSNIGFKVLINQVEDIGPGLQIAGIPDPAAKQFQLEAPQFSKVAEQLKKESFKIMLSHQPSLGSESEKIGMNLQLSGHTHGGQFFPWNWLIVFFQRYAKGLYHLGNMQLYVNQGTGYWGPRLRLGTYCELTEIILRKDQKTG